jgi:hypothetical protein
MSLLDVVTDVAQEAGYEVASSVIGSTDPTTLQLKQMAQRIIEEMADAYPWPQLNRTASITLVASTGDYALPADFSRYHYDTWFNQSTNWKLIGPMTEQEYIELVGLDDPAAPATYFTIQGITDTSLTIYPTPGAGEDGDIIIFRYVAARPIRPRTWAAGQTVVIGDYTFYNGLYFVATSAGTTGATAPTGTGSDGGVSWELYTGSYTQFLADTDVPVISERILKQGVLERFAEIKGLSVAQRYEQQLAEEYGKQRPGRIISASDCGGPKQWGWNGRVHFGSR